MIIQRKLLFNNLFGLLILNKKAGEKSPAFEFYIIN